MNSIYKEDLKQAQQRVEAWWEGSILDRVPIRITAPKSKIKGLEKWIMTTGFPGVGPELLKYMDPMLGIHRSENTPEDLEKYFFDPDRIIGIYERLLQDTFWGGEAIPTICPVRPVAILANYLDSPMNFKDTYTVWSEPIIKSWEDSPSLEFNPDNKWWKKTEEVLKKFSKRAYGKYYIALPDLNGPGAVLDILRGTERLLIDTVENKNEIKAAMGKINQAWFKCWQECNKIIHKYIKGFMNAATTIWSEKPSTDLQCDFSSMISPDSFKELFLPYIEEQIEMVPRGVYHLDGPQALIHLDNILSVPGIKAIQWIPGAGSKPMSEWISELGKMQEAGKSIICICEKWEVEKLIKELNPEGLMIETTCGSKDEAYSLLNNVKKWM